MKHTLGSNNAIWEVARGLSQLAPLAPLLAVAAPPAAGLLETMRTDRAAARHAFNRSSSTNMAQSAWVPTFRLALFGG